MPPQPDAPVLAVLDSEALAVLAFPRERGRAARRAQAVLVAVQRLGGRAWVPAPVIAELRVLGIKRCCHRGCDEIPGQVWWR